ncbi:MAG: glutamate ABC transporter substrate-binding protein [Brachybacterium sp.]|nr:glutamate ABC transporter substrate-binding protein [Brachybacterium sp.]
MTSIRRTTTTGPRPGRRTIVAAGSALPIGALLAACADSGDAPEVPGGEEGENGDDAEATGAASSDYDAVIAEGPLADDATVEASPWASAIREADVLRRGGTTTNQVFSLEDPATGTITGFDAGITQLLARYILGEDGADKVDYLDTTVDTRETMVANGTVDCVVATYSITPERLEQINFAGPYYLSGTAIQVMADNDDVEGPEDLEGLQMTTQSNSTGLQAILDHVPGATESQIQQFGDNEQCLAALTQGRVDAYVLDQGVLLGNVVADDSVKVVGEPFVDDPYGIGLSQDHEDALEFVNTFLETIQSDDTWDRLYEATIGQVIDGDAPEPPQIGDLPS